MPHGLVCKTTGIIRKPIQTIYLFMYTHSSASSHAAQLDIDIDIDIYVLLMLGYKLRTVGS